MNELQTIPDIITALGGAEAVQSMTGRSAKAVSMWKTLGRLPWHTQLSITDALRAQGKYAAPSLWGLPSKKKDGTAARA